MLADSIPSQEPAFSLCLSASTHGQRAGKLPRHSLIQWVPLLVIHFLVSFLIHFIFQKDTEYPLVVGSFWPKMVIHHVVGYSVPQQSTGWAFSSVWVHQVQTWCFERSRLEKPWVWGSSLGGSSGFLRRGKEICLSFISCDKICRAEQKKKLIFSS